MGGNFVSLTPRLRRYAHALLGKWPTAPCSAREGAPHVNQDADDLVHDALLDFWRVGHGRFRCPDSGGPGTAPDGGLLLELYRRVTALGCRQWADAAIGPMAFGAPDDESDRAHEQAPHFAWAPEARALPSLAPDLRAPLALIVLEQLSYRQAGVVLGMPTERALARLIVARARLASGISGLPRSHLIAVSSLHDGAKTLGLAGGPVTERDLHALVDEQLDENRRDEVKAFLESHPESTRRAAEWRRQSERLRRAFEPLLRQPLPLSLDFATPDARFRAQSGRTGARAGVFRALAEILSPRAAHAPVAPG